MHLHEIFGLLTQPSTVSDLLERNWLLGLVLAAAIIFLETGVVVFPFLPGDSLLFALGAAAAVNRQPLWQVLMVIAVAAILGDAVNYTLGRTAAGPWVLRRGWVREQHLDRTRSYFARYGGSAVTVARFVPVVRTLAPFIAGISHMAPRRFLAFNVLGGCLWAALLLGFGAFAGRIPWVQGHFTYVTLIIIAVSLVPLAIQWRQAVRMNAAQKPSR